MIIFVNIHTLNDDTMWEFQNGKSGLCSSKINRDSTKNAKIQILKNNNFCKEKYDILTKAVIFQNLNFYTFCCILVNFWAT